MKTVASKWDEKGEALGSETCEEGLNFLAYVIREDIIEGHRIDPLEFEGLRRVATELLILVARWLAQLSLLPQKTASHATLELRATRLFEVTRAVVDPETTPRELADALQSVADLIRSSRRLAAGERHAALN